LPKLLMNQVTRFRQKQKKSFLDVWWLYDDGGQSLNCFGCF
jgi:hypothetical protein